MPVTKTAIREIRVAERRKKRNKALRTKAKSDITRAEKAIFSGGEASKQAVTEAISALDKAAEKGMIHRNNAARRKARLVKKLNKAKASAPKSEPAK